MMRILNVSGIGMLFLCATISCTSIDKKAVGDHVTFGMKDFKTTTDLKGEVLRVDSLVVPSRICVIPEYNLLIVADKGTNFLAKAYTLDSLKLIKYFVKKGEGPNEQLSIFHLQYDPLAKCLNVSDFYKRRIFNYAIDSIISSSITTLPINNINFREMTLNKPVFISANKILDLRDNSQGDSIGVFNFYNDSGAITGITGKYPPIEKQYEKHQLWDVFAAGLNKSTDGSTIIVNYFNTDYLELYDTTGRLVKRVQGPDISYPDYRSQSVAGGGVITQPSKKQRNAYCGLAKMQNNILVLYNGNPVGEGDDYSTMLFQFSNHLTPETFYKLDIPVFLFDVDWTSRTVYGLTREKEGAIIKYKL
jgi:hypothetical protein